MNNNRNVIIQCGNIVRVCFYRAKENADNVHVHGNEESDESSSGSINPKESLVETNHVSKINVSVYYGFVYHIITILILSPH